jgi:hypothetical protein
MSDFWYALASRISADAFAPLGHPAGPAPRARRIESRCADAAPAPTSRLPVLAAVLGEFDELVFQLERT